MFPCDTCTQFRDVFHCSKTVNPDNIPFQTKAWIMQNNAQCYRMRSAHLSKIRSVMAALKLVFWKFDSAWRYRSTVTFAAFTRSYVVTTLKQACLAGFETGCWHCSNSAKYNNICCRLSYTAGRCTALVVHFFQISYVFDKRQLYEHEAKSNDEMLK